MNRVDDLARSAARASAEGTAVSRWAGLSVALGAAGLRALALPNRRREPHRWWCVTDCSKMPDASLDAPGMGRRQTARVDALVSRVCEICLASGEE